MLAEWLGVDGKDDSRGSRAADAFRQAGAADPDYAGAWQRLGAALVATDVAESTRGSAP